MVDVTLTVPAPVKWLNSNDRLHRMAEAKLSAVWRQAGKTAGTGTAFFDEQVRVVAYVFKPRRGRYDPGNLYPTAKACVDGFTDAGLWPDDDWTHVVGPDMRHGGIGPAALVFVITPELVSDSFVKTLHNTEIMT